MHRLNGAIRVLGVDNAERFKLYVGGGSGSLHVALHRLFGWGGRELRAFSVCFFIFAVLVSFNILDIIGTYQFSVSSYDISAVNTTLSTYLPYTYDPETGQYIYNPDPVQVATQIFGNIWLMLNMVLTIFLNSTVYLPKILQDFGIPWGLALMVAIPYNIIFFYGVFQLIANRGGRVER